jgi:hypothetical protein
MLFIVSKASNFVGQLDRSLPANRDLFQSAAEDVYIYICSLSAEDSHMFLLFADVGYLPICDVEVSNRVG